MDNNSEQKIGMDESCAEQIVEIKNENAELKNEEEMEEKSTSMNNASSNNGKNEQKSNKKSLKFGGWLPDVLDWFKRPELAQTSLSTSSYIFNRYCWPKLHGKVKPRTVPLLIFLNDWHNGNRQTILIVKRGDRLFDEIPIADIEPPEYIIGFEQINFQSINDRALQFMEKILPLLKEDVQMDFACGKIVNNPQIGPIKRLMGLLASKPNKLEIFGSKDVNKFNEQFPGFITGVQSIRLYNCTKSDADWLMEWLMAAPREDSTPKILQIELKHNSLANAKTIIDRVKTEFANSIGPVNFIVQIGYEKVLELQCKNRNKYFCVRRKIDGQTNAKFNDLKKQFDRREAKTIIRIDID